MSESQGSSPSLLPVPDEEIVIRLIHPRSFDPNAPAGQKVSLAAFPRDEFRPKGKGNGPSLFLASRLPHGIRSLEAANPRWVDYGYAEVSVKELKAIGLEVHLTPGDCNLEEVKDAHASVTSRYDGVKRASAVALLNENLVREPRRP